MTPIRFTCSSTRGNEPRRVLISVRTRPRPTHQHRGRKGTPTFLAALVALAVASGDGLAAQTPTPLTLAQATERALAANPAVMAARLQRPVDVAGVAVAGERPNPEVAFEAAKETPRQAIGAALPIELGGKRQARIDVANAMVAVTDAELARVMAAVRSEVRRAYFDVRTADQHVTLADELLGLATRARDAARARVDAGDVPQADLTQASLALASSENEAAAARGEAVAARAELNALLGQPPDTPLTLADDPAGSSLPSFADALAVATQGSAEIGVLDRQIEAQQARVALARTQRMPDASIGAAFTYDAEPEFQRGWRVTGGVTLPILTTHRAGVILEEAELTRLQGVRQAVVSMMGGAIAAALARASSARDQVGRYQNQIVPLLVEAERQAQVSYSAGQTGLVTLVQALQTARTERQRGLQAMQDFQQALVDLERAMGVPLP